MALQSLLEALARRTSDEVAAVRNNARAEAATILRIVDERAAGHRVTLLREHECTLRDEAERAVGAARREARRMELEARQRLLDRVLSAVGDRVPDAGGTAALGPGLSAKLAAAFNGLGDVPAVIHASADLADALRPLAKHRHDVTVAVDPGLRAGFRLESADGHVTVDATLDGYLQRDRHAVVLAALRAIGETS